jgi:hypothetical protein
MVIVFGTRMSLGLEVDESQTPSRDQKEGYVKKLMLAVAILAMTSAAFAGPAVTQLGSAVGVVAADTSVQAPSAPEAQVTADDGDDTKNRCNEHHQNLPGCPGYCAKHQWHSSCALPFHCKNNMQLYACKKHCQQYPQSQGCRPQDKSAAAGEELFDPEQAVANVEEGLDAVNEDEAKSICSKHHMRPGCPMYCKMNPLSKACYHRPAYCNTNPNGYGCNKSVEEDVKATAAGEEEAGEGLFDPELVVQQGLDVVSEDEAKSICSKHHMRPGCPMYCQMNPMSKACGHKPAYCHTNPNGFGCK